MHVCWWWQSNHLVSVILLSFCLTDIWYGSIIRLNHLLLGTCGTAASLSSFHEWFSINHLRRPIYFIHGNFNVKVKFFGICIWKSDNYVEEIVMQNIEEQSLATYTQTGPLWLHYVDDTFTTVRKDRINDFHKHLNRQNRDIQFTKAIKENGKIPFLDLLGHLWQQQTKNDYLQKTDTYRPITRPVFVQPDLSQGYYYPDFDEMSATTLRLTWQPTRWDWLS